MGCLPPINWCRISSIHRMMQSPSIAPFAQRHVLSGRRHHSPGDQGTQRLSQARERRQEETVESLRRSELRATKDSWLVVDLPLSWSVGMMTFPIYGRIKYDPNHQPDGVFLRCSWGFQRNLDGKIFDQWRCSMGKSSMEVFQWDLMGFEQQMVRMFSSWDDGKRWNSAGSC